MRKNIEDFCSACERQTAIFVVSADATSGAGVLSLEKGVHLRRPSPRPPADWRPKLDTFLLLAAVWRTFVTQNLAKQLQGSNFRTKQKRDPRSCFTMVFKVNAKQLREAPFCLMWKFDPCSSLGRFCAVNVRQAAARSKTVPNLGRQSVGGRGLGLRKCTPFSRESTPAPDVAFADTTKIVVWRLQTLQK